MAGASLLANTHCGGSCVHQLASHHVAIGALIDQNTPDVVVRFFPRVIGQRFETGLCYFDFLLLQGVLQGPWLIPAGCATDAKDQRNK
jgi:hypothetical protein